jgi:hypothetical protein
MRFAEMTLASGLPTWSEIWCDVENSKSFRSSHARRVSRGHRLRGLRALHNYLASIFTAPGVATWNDMPGSSGKNQVTRLVTLRNRSKMSGVLITGQVACAFEVRRPSERCPVEIGQPEGHPAEGSIVLKPGAKEAPIANDCVVENYVITEFRAVKISTSPELRTSEVSAENWPATLKIR